MQIDIDGRLLGMRYAPTECNLVGDAKDTLQALIPLLQRKEDRSWREQLEQEIERWWKLMDERAHLDAQPINPQLVFAELQPAAARQLHPHLRLGLGDQLVGAPPADAQGHEGGAVGHAGHDVPGRARTRWRPSSPIPTGR